MGDDEGQAGRRNKGIEKNAKTMANRCRQPSSPSSGLDSGQDDRKAWPRGRRAKNADKCEGQPVGNAHGGILAQIKTVGITLYTCEPRDQHACEPRDQRGLRACDPVLRDGIRWTMTAHF